GPGGRRRPGSRLRASLPRAPRWPIDSTGPPKGAPPTPATASGGVHAPSPASAARPTSPPVATPLHRFAGEIGDSLGPPISRPPQNAATSATETAKNSASAAGPSRTRPARAANHTTPNPPRPQRRKRPDGSRPSGGTAA